MMTNYHHLLNELLAILRLSYSKKTALRTIVPTLYFFSFPAAFLEYSSLLSTKIEII